MIGVRRVAIYTQDNVNDYLIYNHIKDYGFELVKCKDQEKFLSAEINLKVIHANIGHHEIVDIISKIRTKYTKSQVGIIVCLEKENVKYLLEYMELGVNDYIKLPYSVEELYVTLTKNLNILDEDTKFQVTIDNLPFPIWVNDLDGKYVNANQKFANVLNTTVENMMRKNPKDFYDDDEVNKIENQNIDIINQKTTMKFYSEYILDNKNRVAEVYKTPVFNAYNEIVGITGTIIDITDLKDAQEKAKVQALSDPLTLLANRRALYEYIKEVKPNDKISAILIDIDNFKFINDTYGHKIGDCILIKFAKKLKKVCKDSFVCRLGGDEFLVVFKNIENVKKIECKAQELINKEVDYLGEFNKYQVSVSIGIVVDEVEYDINKILVKADLAMYKAKEKGKNNYVLYTQEIGLEREIKLEIENSIKEFKKRNDLKLYYQPQYTVDNKIKGFEALLRWENEKYRNVPIIDVIKIMEQSDLIIDIGYFIIKKAFEFAKKVNKNSKGPLLISVNISAIQIMDKDFIKNIRDILKETNVNPKYIGIELTETALLKDMKTNAVKVGKLKDMGMTILIDDFGTGYSSISYLLGIPINTIKIDKSLVELIHIEEKYKNIIELITRFAKVSDLKLVAEGVENKHQLKILKDMEVDYFQGYLFNKPLKEEDVIKLLELE